MAAALGRPLDDDCPTRRYRTVFISDVHLGTRGCQAELLLDFIRHVECESLYLIGDIVDGWRLKGGWYWPQAHNDVVQKVLRLARKGVRVVYVPGNHDEFARDYCGAQFGGVEVVRDAVLETADGKRLLIVHGDEFDGVLGYAKWLSLLGDWAYAIVLELNTWLNRARRRLGFGYWSLSAYLKGKVKNAVQFIADFESAVADEARPNYLCNYLYDLASLYSKFYDTCPVLKAPEPVRSARLILCDLTAKVLKLGLDCLGIEVSEKM